MPEAKALGLPVGRKTVTMGLDHAIELLELLQRIGRENAENKNAIGERVAFLQWGTQVRLEEAIEILDEQVDASESGAP